MTFSQLAGRDVDRLKVFVPVIIGYVVSCLVAPQPVMMYGGATVFGIAVLLIRSQQIGDEQQWRAKNRQQVLA